MEQTLELNTGLYMVFLDLEKAFDSVDRDVESVWDSSEDCQDDPSIL